MKKFTAFMLAMIMIFSMFLVAPMSTSAVATETVNVDGLYVRVGDNYYQAEKGQIFTYQYCLSIEESTMITGIFATINYDNDGLEFVPAHDEYGDDDVDAMFPITGAKTIYNYNRESEIIFNYSSITGVRIGEKGVIFSGQFRVTADKGVYDIYAYLDTLHGVDLTVLAASGVKYDEFSEHEFISDLGIAEDASSEPTQEETTVDEKNTIYLINTAWPNATIQAVVSSSSTGETATIYMYKVAMNSPNGAPVYKAFIDDGYDTVYFKNTTSKKTESTQIIENWFYDNLTNKWYENLEDSPSEKIFVKLDGKIYEVKKGDIITYDMTLKYMDAKIGSLDVNIKYDANGLKLLPTVDEYGDVDALSMFPTTGYATVFNLNKAGYISFNYSSITGVRFMKDNSLVFKGQFEITADKGGVYEINGLFKTIADTSLNKIVFDYVTIKEFETSESLEGLTGVEIDPQQPSSEEPSTSEDSSEDFTIEPTEIITDPPTSDPTIDDFLVPEFYVIAGDSALFGSNWDPADRNNELTSNGDGTYSKIYENVAAGTYHFKVTTNGCWDIGDYNLEGDASFGGDNAVAVVLKDDATVTVGFDGMKATLVIEYKSDDNQTEAPTFDPSEGQTEETSEPISEEPSSQVPSSEEPSSEAPSSEAPSSEEPSSEEPSSEEPSSEEPSSEEPSSEEPSSEEPSSEEPSSEEPSQPIPPEDPIDPDVPVVEFILGDLDFNGSVQVLDATIIQRSEARFDQLTDEQKLVADTNKDGVVNVLDATMIQRLVARFITEF